MNVSGKDGMNNHNVIATVTAEKKNEKGEVVAYGLEIQKSNVGVDVDKRDSNPFLASKAQSFTNDKGEKVDYVTHTGTWATADQLAAIQGASGKNQCTDEKGRQVYGFQCDVFPNTKNVLTPKFKDLREADFGGRTFDQDFLKEQKEATKEAKEFRAAQKESKEAEKGTPEKTAEKETKKEAAKEAEVAAEEPKKRGRKPKNAEELQAKEAETKAPSMEAGK